MVRGEHAQSDAVCDKLEVPTTGLVTFCASFILYPGAPLYYFIIGTLPRAGRCHYATVLWLW
jgi:hypothetical protein